MAKNVGRGYGLGGVVKAVQANPNPNRKAVEAYPTLWGMVKAVGAWPRQWRGCQGRGGVAKAVGGGQNLGGVAKAVGAWPRPWVRC